MRLSNSGDMGVSLVMRCVRGFQIEFALPRNSIENPRRTEGDGFTLQVHKLRMAAHSITSSARLILAPGMRGEKP